MTTRKSLHRANKRRIMRNVFMISIAWVLLFAAFSSLQTLQSSINRHEGLGTASLSVVYGSLFLSSLFVPTVLIRYFGCKWAIAMSMIGYITYIVCNFWMSWYTLIPGSIVVGIGGAPLWTAKCTYLTEMSISYAHMSREVVEDVIARFFGYFYFTFQAANIIGNLVSSAIFSRGVQTNYSNLDISNCGIDYCMDNENNTNLKLPDKAKIYTLMGVYTGLSLCALVLILFMDNSKNSERKRAKLEIKKFLSTFVQMKDKYQLLLIPITVHTGLEVAYIKSEFTKAYVSCSLGIWMVGYVMICYGVFNAIGSFLSGKLTPCIGRIPILLSSAVLSFGCYIVLMVWKPGNSPSQIVIFFVMAGIMGLCDSICYTITIAFYGVNFQKHSEAAFANFRLWNSVGYILAFGYSNALCVRVKTYVVCTTLMIGISCYGITEFCIRRDSNKNDAQEGPSYTLKIQKSQENGDLSLH